MVKNDSYFYISGLISISLFTSVLALFFYMLFSSNKINTYSLVKDNYISVSVHIPKIETTKTKKEISSNLVDAPISAESKEVNIDDLFSDVVTKKIQKQKIEKIEKKIDYKRLQQIQKRIKTTKKNEVRKISEKVDSLNSVEVEDEVVKQSTSNEVNEYLAKIQALVYRYFNPPQNSQGHSVKAVIYLSALGKVIDFRILNYSSNTILNEECKKIKNRLENVVFPINPQNKSVNYTIILTSKE